MIKVFHKPTIVLDEMAIGDFENGTGESPVTDKNFQLSKYVGSLSPYIQINGMKFNDELIQNFKLDIGDTLPRIRVTLREKGGVFQSKFFPKDGDILSLYIKSSIKKYKPVRNDYYITKVSSKVSEDKHGEINTFTITGVLNLRFMYTEHILSYPNMSSFECLKQLSENFGLGFASNVAMTNDKMTWLCPSHNLVRFLRDVSHRSYLNDNSFFKVFIDQYYNLNFIEVNKTIKSEIELKDSYTHFISNIDYLRAGNEPENLELPLLISNSKEVEGTPAHIVGYTPINNSGEISLSAGYRRYIQSYSRETKGFEESFLETLNTDGSKEKLLLKGRESDDSFRQHAKYKWLGDEDLDNVHENYHYAIVNNYQNNLELKKMGIKALLGYPNHSIYMFVDLPVIIINDKSQVRKHLTQDEDAESSNTGTMDKFLSGPYVVTSMTYMYESSTRAFTHEITCMKREWEKPL